MRFVEEHRSRYGVEPICRVLSEHGLPIAPSTYYAARVRAPSPRARRDVVLSTEVLRVHRSRPHPPGARVVWQQLRADGIAVGRSTVERLMREQGLGGVPTGRPRDADRPDRPDRPDPPDRSGSSRPGQGQRPAEPRHGVHGRGEQGRDQQA